MSIDPLIALHELLAVLTAQAESWGLTLAEVIAEMRRVADELEERAAWNHGYEEKLEKAEAAKAQYGREA